MAQVFISWSSSDAPIALRLARVLKNAGFTVDEYSDDPTGGSIFANVQRYVDEAQVALILLSPESVKKDWIHTEVTLCFNQRARGLEIVPLIVRDVAASDLPHLIRAEPLLRRFPVPTGTFSSKDELTLKETIRTTLKLPAPIVVPAAFFAMTRAEAAALLTKGTDNDLVGALCSAVGMESFPPLANSLLSRYGDEAEDFAPFPNGTLKELVEETIGETNRSREERPDSPPLWIWWCTEALLEPAHADNTLASELWERGPSIAIVDSISVLHPDIYQQFTNLPDPDQATASALLWVPPYTLHTAQLAQVTETSVNKLTKLMRKAKKWGSESGGYLAFDIGTRPTLRRWLHQVFVHAEIKPKPQTRNVAAMKRLSETAFKNTGVFYTS